MNEEINDKKERNRISQQKRRQRLIDEIGIDEFRKQTKEQVANHRLMNKISPNQIYNNIINDVIKLDEIKLKELKNEIDKLINPIVPQQPPPIHPDNKIFCDVCNLWIYKSNITRHKKTSKHIKNIKEMND